MRRNIYLITPVKGDPLGHLARLETYMARQTIPWHRWVVVSNGDDEEFAGLKFNKGQQVLRQPAAFAANWEGCHPLCLNYLWGVTTSRPERNEVVACVEYDEWFREDYLETLLAALEEVHLVGFAPAVYFNTQSQAIARWPIETWASLTATGMTPEVLPWFRSACRRESPFIDQYLWQTWDGSKRLLDNLEPVRQVGIKDGSGVGMGHMLAGPKDNGELRAIMGADADNYLK